MPSLELPVEVVMLIRLQCIALLTLFVSASAYSSPLDGYLFDTRPLILFATSENDPALKEQLRLLNDKNCEFFERDIEVLVVVSGRSNHVDGQVLSSDEINYLREELEVAPYNDLAVLVGKDGRVKLRAHMPLSTADLFMLVDAMPMRRAESMSNSRKRCYSA